MFFYNILSYDTLDDIEEKINNSKNDKSNNENDNDCCICLEKYLCESNTTAKNINDIIKTTPLIIKTCNCSYIVHTECFNEWFINNGSCIICRKMMNEIIIINNHDQHYISRYFIVRVTVKLINGILIANYTIYIFKTIYRTLATIFLYSILIYYLVNLIKRQYERMNIDIEYETLE